MQVPLDERIKELLDVPYTISFVIRKRIQIDNLNELPKDKRPPESMIWDGSSDEIEDWLNRVIYKNSDAKLTTFVDTDSIEG